MGLEIRKKIKIILLVVLLLIFLSNPKLVFATHVSCGDKFNDQTVSLDSDVICPDNTDVGIGILSKVTLNCNGFQICRISITTS